MFILDRQKLIIHSLLDLFNRFYFILTVFLLIPNLFYSIITVIFVRSPGVFITVAGVFANQIEVHITYTSFSPMLARLNCSSSISSSSLISFNRTGPNRVIILYSPVIHIVLLCDYSLHCSLLTIYYLLSDFYLIITFYLMRHHFYNPAHIFRTLTCLHQHQPSYHLALLIGLYFQWVRNHCSSWTRSSVMISCH